MKAIFSYWQSNQRHSFCNEEMAKLSNDLAKKNGYETCLYTDTFGFEKLNNYVKYDKIILFDENILKCFYSKIWSLGKILAMSLVDGPFIHLDFDLFLFAPLEKHLLEKDFFTLYHEPWIDNMPEVKNDVNKIFNLYRNNKNINFSKVHSYNCSIVGGKNFKKINHICNIILELAINQHIELKNLYESGFESPDEWILPVTFEQILIPNLLNKIYNIENYTIFPNFNSNFYYETKKMLFLKSHTEHLKKCFIENKILHLHGNKTKKFEIVKNRNTYLI